MESSRFIPNITTEELAAHELSWFRGEIVVVEDIKSFHNVIPRLRNCDLLGFDTETKPSFKKGKRNNVSLIQLANDKLAVLIRINKIGIPDELIKLLGDPNILKAGVALHDDLRFLKGIKNFKPEGFIELQTLVKEYGIESAGLKKLTAIILGFRISKSQQVTNWESDVLTEPQILYAATDAWVCHQIYRKLTRIEVRSA
jgi:ribonuclease D